MCASYKPEQVNKSSFNSYPVLHSQTKLPTVFLHTRLMASIKKKAIYLACMYMPQIKLLCAVVMGYYLQ